MQNEMRDRLIELIDIEYDGEPNCLLCEEASDKCQKCEHRWEYKLADHLIENGVIVPPNNNIGELSDGYHTFNELYHHRAILFSVICNLMPDKAWKSKLHDTGDMFDGMFIVGIETPNGQATYHYDINPYWDIFKVREFEKAPKWDGHTPTDAINRIANITEQK